MAGQKFFALIANKLKEIAGTQVSTGVSDANKIIALNSVGLIDITLLPTGVGTETINAPTSENLAAGDFVNIYSNSGVLTLRKADSTTNAKPAQGFVIANSVSPENATLYILGVSNNFRSALAIGMDYVLSKDVPGGVTAIGSYVGVAGNIIQVIGKGISAQSMLTFQNQNYQEIS